MKPDKNTAQAIGSAITYGGRYQLTALLGISSEDDDDGNIASKTDKKSKRLKTASTDLKDDIEAKKWIDEIKRMLVEKKFDVTENAIISKARQHYDTEKVERIEAQLKKK